MRKNKKVNQYTKQEKINYYRSRLKNKKLSSGKRLYAKGKLMQLEYDVFKVVHSNTLMNIPNKKGRYALVISRGQNGNVALSTITSLDGHDGKLDFKKWSKVKRKMLLPLKRDSIHLRRPSAISCLLLDRNLVTNDLITDKDFDSELGYINPLDIDKVNTHVFNNRSHIRISKTNKELVKML